MMTKNIMKHDYDLENDILFFYLKNNHSYEFSEVLDKSFVLDFSKDKIPVGLEIAKASEIFKTKKHILTNIAGGNIEITISEETMKISINLIVNIHLKRTHTEPVNVVGDNDLNIPSIQTEVAVASS